MEWDAQETTTSRRLFIWSFFILLSLFGFNGAIISNQVKWAFQQLPTARSIASQDVQAKSKSQSIPVISWNCANPSPLPIATLASNARMVFQNCPVAPQITNLTNKGQVHLFQVLEQEWTSDFFNLNEGKNKVEVRMANQTHVIWVNREPKPVQTTEKEL